MHLVGTLSILILLAGYPLVNVILLRSAQPWRLRLADLARELLARDDISSSSKHVISAMLRDAYSTSFMFWMMLSLPIFGVQFFFRSRKSEMMLASKEAKVLIFEFIDCHTLATSAANPICSIVVALEMALLTAVLVPIGKLSKGRDVQASAVWQTELRSHRAMAT